MRPISAYTSPEAMPDAVIEQRARARIGTTLNGKYRLDRLLGVGGMASVYAASHRNGQRAALKVLHNDFARDRTICDRFLREGYVSNKIGHPACVAVLDDDKTEDIVAVLRAERDQLQAIVNSYPRDAAGQVESLERDVERLRAHSENWTGEAQRARSELAALGPLARRGKHANELSFDIDRSERRAYDAGEAERNAAARLAQIHDGPDSPRRWEAEHPHAREQLREAQQAFNDAVQCQADRAIEQPGEHLVRVLGERPSEDRSVERDTWDRAARAIEAYRITYEIDPSEATALGPEPIRRDSPLLQHIDWERAGKHVLDAREQLAIEDPGLGPIEERMARVMGLMPEHDRAQALERGHGWER